MNLFLVIAFLFLVSKASCDTKKWIYTSHILDPRNWETNDTQRTCDGLVFASDNPADVTISDLVVKRVILPSFGTLKFSPGESIAFDEKSDNQLNCIKLKPMGIKMWTDISGWINIDDPDNPAIPYTERIPSKFDDVIFPCRLNNDIILNKAKFKSVTVKEDDKILASDNNQLFDMLNPDLLNDFQVTNAWCYDVTGCAGGLPDYLAASACLSYLKKNGPFKANCRDPISPKGFCKVPQCGASIIIENYSPGFRLDKIKNKLEEYKSYTYANKISDTSSQIQIIFMEKDFVGRSIDEATDFYDLLRQDDSYFCGNVKLETSGPSEYEEETHVKNTLSIVFGTLTGVVLMFGFLFVLYSPTVGNLNIRNRVLGNRPLSTYILRYDNIEDRGYIIDGQSVAGSIVNLHRSFENPMYEQPSTRSTSNETIASVKMEGPQDKNEEIKSEEVDVDLEEAQELTEAGASKEVDGDKDDILLKDI